MRKYRIKLTLQERSNLGLAAFARYVAKKLTANVNYPILKNPTLPDFKTLVTDYEEALTKRGTGGYHGTTLDVCKANEKRKLVEQALRGIVAFCSNQTPDNVEAFLSAGFSVKRPNRRIALVNAVLYLRQHNLNPGCFNTVILKWMKPRGIGRGIVKTYQVYRSETSDFKDAKFVSRVTKTTFKDTGLTISNYYYWIIPVSAVGDGLCSNGLRTLVIL